MIGLARRRRVCTAQSTRIANLAWSCLAGCLLLGAPSLASASGALGAIETEFEKAIKNVSPATVVCFPEGVHPSKVPVQSSGVIVSRKGLVLSDGDAGIWFDIKGTGRRRRMGKPQHADKIEIRIPNLKGKGYRAIPAEVIHRDRKLDTSLIRMIKPPSGLKYVTPGSSDDLDVGEFVFAMGNSFGMAAEAPPTLTAGVLSALVPFDGSSATSRYQHLYVSAAINRGVNGGPVVDVSGRLIGTVSNMVPPKEAFQFLGKIVPIDRLREHYASHDAYDELFPKRKLRKSTKNRKAAAMELIYRTEAKRLHSSVVSIVTTRKKGGEIDRAAPGQGGVAKIPHHAGPCSGVLFDHDGHVVTSLYNLANVGTLVHPTWTKNVPPQATVEAGIKGIESIEVVIYGERGASEPHSATLLGYQNSSNLAVLKIEGGLPVGAKPIKLAPTSAYETGRFVMALGNPFGGQKMEAPLLTVGVLSKVHGDDVDPAWWGHWQTDAAVTDGNAGGALVDLEGRMLGMLTLWSPLMLGRNSGIGMVLPSSRIEPAVRALAAGKTTPWLGVRWGWDDEATAIKVNSVLDDSPAFRGGLRQDDEIVRVFGKDVKNLDLTLRKVKSLWSDDILELSVRRDGKIQDLDVKLGSRPEPKATPEADKVKE